jgi:hypothetical protein
MRFPAPIIAILGLYVALSGCRTGSRGNLEGQSPPANNTTIVEAGCGTCVFHMDGVKGCPLAVRIDGQAYLVEGTSFPSWTSSVRIRSPAFEWKCLQGLGLRVRAFSLGLTAKNECQLAELVISWSLGPIFSLRRLVERCLQRPAGALHQLRLDLHVEPPRRADVAVPGELLHHVHRHRPGEVRAEAPAEIMHAALGQPGTRRITSKSRQTLFRPIR